MTNIIDARYPKGKVETMSNDFFSTSKVLEGMRENLPMLSGADLDDLKDAIMDELKAREHKQVIELKEKAIQSLRDFFNAGGCGNTVNHNLLRDSVLYQKKVTYGKL